MTEQNSAAAAAGSTPGTGMGRAATASVSAGIAEANAHLPDLPEPAVRFPPEDGGRSLAEVAQRDLDAALHLLAERAQYITGASGAAIALRRGQHHDMLCRASAGENVPELGALLSMEYGLSGESIRTCQTLRCDDTESDSRVNREGCRRLGIASVVVMPILCDEQAIGVFELFSGQPNVFAERDISALQRLSGMVETAVKHAMASQNVLAVQRPQLQAGEPFHPVRLDASANGDVSAAAPLESPARVNAPDLATAPPKSDLPRPLENVVPGKTEPAESKPAPAPQKPLLWSAAIQMLENASARAQAAEPMSVPSGLRNLQKCHACGFPVSQGRTLCVECEQKQWRGDPLPQPVPEPLPAKTESKSKAQPQPDAPNLSSPDPRQVSAAPALSAIGLSPSDPSAAGLLGAPPDAPQEQEREEDPLPADATAMFSTSTVDSQSWFAANKYVLGALLVIAMIVAAIIWRR